MRLIAGRLLLVVVLLSGWQAALVHPLTHVDEHGHLVHAAEGHEHGGDASSDPSDKICDALSALTACATSEATAIALAASGARHVRYIAERLRRADPPPFLSQGPPALL